MTAALSPQPASPPPVAEPVPCAAAALSVHELAVSYAGTPALRDVSLELAAGRVTAILGPSGCGKTSFLWSLNRMLDLVPGCRVEGGVRLGGADIYAPDVDVRALRRRIGLVFQRPNPFPLSIRRNLELPLREHGMRDPHVIAERIEEVLTAVGLWAEVKDRLGAPALALSGGQQQRLCIARALALGPEVLLCDEPCSALDPIASATVESLLGSLRGRFTVVIVTHNLAQARRISDASVLFWAEGEAGGIVESGDTERLFGAPEHPVTRAYLSGARG